jgi:hypothetical protein
VKTPQSADDYRGCCAIEDENILIANYWLDFVSARDDRECQPARYQPGGDLHAKLQTFTQRINALLETQEKLREAIATAPAQLGCEQPPEEFPPAQSAGNPNHTAASENVNLCSHQELPDMNGPFAKGRQFVSNCLRDSFILDVLEKMS